MAGPLAGKNMKVTVANSVNSLGATFACKVTDCNSVLRTQWVDISNSESGGYDEEVANFFGGDIDITIVGNIEDSYYQRIGNGMQVTVNFYPARGTAGSFIQGTLNVATWESRGQVKGAWMVRVTGHLNGVYTPTVL